MKKLGFVLFMTLAGITQIGCGSNDPPPPPITAAQATNINNCLTGTTSIGYNCPPQLAQATAGLREVPVTPTTLNAGQILANNQAIQNSGGLPLAPSNAVLASQGIAATPVAPGVVTLSPGNPALDAVPAAVKAQAAAVTAALAADTANPESMHYDPAPGTVASSPPSGVSVTASAQQISSTLTGGASAATGGEAAR
jgi:hypothetical protein